MRMRLPPSNQPLLPFAERERGEGEWRSLLEARLSCTVEVAFGRSRSQPIRARFERDAGGRLQRATVRMHRVFAVAPHEVAQAVAAWLHAGRRARRASTLLDDWIEQRMATLPPPNRAQSTLQTSGLHHDLAPLVDSLVAGEFAGEFVERMLPAIGWGRRGRSRCRHSLRLGSYDLNQHVVRIHAVLDRADVPAWYLRFLLFHELLHAVTPAERDGGGRLRHHGPAFRRRERQYADFARARSFEAAILPRLLRAARRR